MDNANNETPPPPMRPRSERMSSVVKNAVAGLLDTLAQRYAERQRPRSERRLIQAYIYCFSNYMTRVEVMSYISAHMRTTQESVNRLFDSFLDELTVKVRRLYNLEAETARAAEREEANQREQYYQRS